jgi:hypothetical protein
VTPADELFPDLHRSGAPYGSLYSTQCKEQFSVAYAHAVTTAARCKLEHVEVDDESVDATIRQSRKHLIYSGAQMDVQLKCTSSHTPKNGYISFPLKKKNFDDLSDPHRLVPVVLVVLLVPEKIEEWISQTDDILTMARSAYWLNVSGLSAVGETSTTVKVPTSQRFDVAQLLGMLQRVGNGGKP